MATPTVPTSGLGIDFPSRRQRFIARTEFIDGIPVQFDTSLVNSDSVNLRVGDAASGLVNGIYPQSFGAAVGRFFGVADSTTHDNQKGYAAVSGIVSLYVSDTGNAGDPVTFGVNESGSRILAIALEDWTAGQKVRCLFDGAHGFGVNLSAVVEDYPVVTITSPADGAEFVEGTSITFTATANDATDGDVSSSLDWESDRDGTLATNDASFAKSDLSVGLHYITATAQDSSMNEGSDSISIIITQSGGGGGGTHGPPDGTQGGTGLVIT